jgi:2-hydroxy-5-methyl-1-naphthoate 7-hydroxylase
MRVKNDHCDVIGVSVAPTQLDNLSSAILQQGMARVSLPGDVVTWAAGRHQTLRRMLSDQRLEIRNYVPFFTSMGKIGMLAAWKRS